MVAHHSKVHIPEMKNSDAKQGFTPPSISSWGSIHDLTRQGGTDGPGDVQKNPGGQEVGSEDGSIFKGDPWTPVD